jgi:lysophospholipase L1-like esterase
VKLPEGNYRVTVTLGAKKRAGNTVVRVEDRRLLVENAQTRKGEYKSYTFTVNRRSPRIDDKRKISLTSREHQYLNWDDKLTFEFNGEAPAVKSLRIEEAPDTIVAVYLCGNSTVVDQRNEPWASWGQMAPRWFDDGVVIINHAQSGLTAGSFLAQHRLEKILQTLKPGDYVLCEFGHNDQKGNRPGDGAWYSFTHNLKIFIDEVRSRGANIILCTPTRRRRFENGQVVNSHGDFPAAIRAIAEREQVPLIDLQETTKTFFEALSAEGSKQALVHYPANTWPKQPKPLGDNTHFNPYGAYEVSKLIVMGMKQLGLPLADHLRSDWQDFDPAHPDNPTQWHWYPSALTDMTKPAGN